MLECQFLEQYFSFTGPSSCNAFSLRSHSNEKVLFQHRLLIAL